VFVYTVIQGQDGMNPLSRQEEESRRALRSKAIAQAFSLFKQELIDAKGWTPRAIERAMGVRAGWLSGIERQRYGLSVEMAARTTSFLRAKLRQDFLLHDLLAVPRPDPCPLPDPYIELIQPDRLFVWRILPLRDELGYLEGIRLPTSHLVKRMTDDTRAAPSPHVLPRIVAGQSSGSIDTLLDVYAFFSDAFEALRRKPPLLVDDIVAVHSSAWRFPRDHHVFGVVSKQGTIIDVNRTTPVLPPHTEPDS